MRVRFLVDGFNVYHGLKQAARDRCKQLQLPQNSSGTKWLDLPRYCRDFVSNECPKGFFVEKIQYFSAYATHLQASQPDVRARHQAYVECLEDQGVDVIMGRFKEITGRTCERCSAPIVRQEGRGLRVSLRPEPR